MKTCTRVLQAVAHLCTTSGWYCRPKMRRSGFSIATMAPCKHNHAWGELSATPQAA